MDRFNEAYISGNPGWETGRPQPAFLALARDGAVRGSVLDAGCGTGENALYFAALGHDVLGVDGAPAAIDQARRKAEARGLRAEFLLHDALALEGLGRTFDTVIDSGLFHTFDDDERARYVASLARALRPGGRYFMLCFSEHEAGSWGPRRVSQAEIRAAFASGWQTDAIEETTIETAIKPEGVRGWRCSITRR